MTLFWTFDQETTRGLGGQNLHYGAGMHVFVGTSGYGYKEWKGSFYPEKLPAQQMLGYYAERFAAVELNGTFYRMPTADDLKALARQTPPTFRFAIKAPQVITHRRRLKNANSELKAFLRAAAALKHRLGPVLFGLPPNMKQDLPRLEAFLKLLDDRVPAAFEFRHASWFDNEVYEMLRAHNVALCLADTDEIPVSKLVSTAPWGYLRLRRVNYGGQRLSTWIKKIRAQPWHTTYVFFKHEDTGTGPRFARQFLRLVAK